MYHSCSWVAEMVEPAPFGSWYQNVVDHVPDDPFQRFSVLKSSLKVRAAVPPRLFGSTDTNHPLPSNIAQLMNFDIWALLPDRLIQLQKRRKCGAAAISCRSAVHENVDILVAGDTVPAAGGG